MLNKRLIKECIFKIISINCLLLLIVGLGLVFFSLVTKSLPNLYRTEIRILNISLEKSPLNIIEENLKELDLIEYKDKILSRSMIYTVANSRTEEIWVSLKSLIIKEKKFQEIWSDLVKKGRVRNKLNIKFFQLGDSAYPETAGIGASIKGLGLVLIISLSISIPIAILSGIFLEIFTSRNFTIKVFELLIFNLSSIPSIVFGILGFAIFSYFNVPRSSPLMGGLTLAIMMVPIINITTRESIRRVPKSIVEGAIALGVSKIHILWDYILPASWNDILKGVLLAVSRIIGETAPLIIVGMVGFVADFPQGFTNPSATISTIIYLWSETPDSDFVSKTATGTIFLLLIVIIINLLAESISKKRLD